MNKLEKIKRELKEEAKKINAENQSDPVKNTIGSLMELEKAFLYGIDKGDKKSKMDKIINEKISEFAEKIGAS